MIDPKLWQAVERNMGWIKRHCKLNEFVVDRRDDLFQEIMENLVRSNQSYMSREIESSDAWVKRVAMNTAATYKRNESRIIRSSEHGDIEQKSDNSSNQQNSAEMKMILQFMAKNFKAQENEMMILHFLGESHASIAELTGITSGGVTNLISQLKKDIRLFIERGSHE